MSLDRHNCVPVLIAIAGLVTSLCAGPTCHAAEIHEAVRGRDFSAAREILEKHRAKAISARDSGDATALHIAAAMNDLDMLVLLIKYGADVNAQTQNGFSPLHWAASRDALATCEYLIVAGADLDAATDHGITPLHWAAANDATNAVTTLLALGASIDNKTFSGLRPLHWALREGSGESAIMLAVSETLERMQSGNTTDSVTINSDLPTMHTGVLKRVRLWETLSVPLAPTQSLEFVWIQDLRMWVGKHEVSNAGFKVFDIHHDSGEHEGLSLNGPQQPAVQVDWTSAKAYCRWLTRVYGRMLPDRYEFRLPTETEWIAYARCGTQRKYPWGDTLPPRMGNYSDNKAKSALSNWRGIKGYDDGFGVTCPVADSGVNEWGLAGVGGNAWEWCEDWYEDAQLYRTRRGGSWYFDGELSLRVDYRGFDLPNANYDTIGFRVVAGPKFEAEASADEAN